MSDRIKAVLPPETLGAVGEGHFTTLCLQAGLAVNKSTHDVTGWDFLVEFPLATGSESRPLDRRQSSACRVQLKSTASSIRASLSLSAAERLAKDPLPAVVVVFRLATDGAPIRGHLVHLIGDNLAHVLKRLRMAHKSKKKLNQETITFPVATAGSAFRLTPQGLREALATACGEDAAAYVAEKQRQLKELGYENGMFEAEAWFRIESQDHLDNVLMGIAPIKPTRFDVFDLRFGIKIPYAGQHPFDVEAGIFLTPATLGPCVVTLRGTGLGEVVGFTADSIVAPPVNGVRLLVRHEEFDITVTDGHLQFGTRRGIDEVHRTLDQWALLLAGLSYLQQVGGTIELRFPEKNLTLPLPSPGELDGPFTDQLSALAMLLRGWQRCVELAGVSSSAAFPMDDIWAAQDVAMAADLLTAQSRRTSLSLPPGAMDEDLDVLEAVYVQSCGLADIRLSYCVRISLARQPDGGYLATQFTPLDVRPEVQSLDAYATEQAEAHGVRIGLLPGNIMLVGRGDDVGPAGTELD